jgi:hypothetical protein
MRWLSTSVGMSGFQGNGNRRKRDGAICEGTTIHKIAPTRFICCGQSSHPAHPGVLNRASENVFDNAEDAVRWYLRWDVRLPGDLDGWKVI